MKDNYPKAYKEVYEIIKNISPEDLLKIPKDVLQTIIDQKDDDYEFQFNGTIENSNLLEETRAILAVLYKNYWTTPHAKKIIEDKIKYDMENIKKKD